jgi:anti-sigma B factor antagonist
MTTFDDPPVHAARTPAPGLVHPTYHRDARVHVIALEGEFDMSNLGRLERAIQQAIGAGGRDFVIDLSEVTFLDATTVHALLTGWKRVTGDNGRLVLVKPPDRIWRLLVMIGRSRTFASFGSQAEALRHLG